MPLVSGVTAFALVVAVVALAYASQAPSLGVAEFAPAARQAVESPPTTGSGGSFERGGGSRRTTTTTAPASTAGAAGPGQSSAPTTRVSRARQCFGNPPLQTEDPMSPPCIATMFEGDNGGAIGRGVNATEVRVAVPWSLGGFASNGSAVQVQRRTLEALFAYMNSRFEFYGRRLVPVYVEGTVNDAPTSRALGAAAAAADTFAALTAPLELSSQYAQAAVVQELARHEMVTVTRNQATWWTDKTMFDPLHPYVWAVAPSSEQLQGYLASLACGLAGKKARFSVTAAHHTETRKFGIVAGGHKTSPNVSQLANTIAACAGEPTVVAPWTNGGGTSNRTAMQTLVNAGVTTVICVCESHYQDWVVSEMEGVSLRPEMILAPSGYAWGDEILPQYWRPSRGPIPMQVQSGHRVIPLQTRPWYQALIALDPGLVNGDKSTLQLAFGMADFAYTSLLVLSSGVQAAGPALTAQSFAAGLMGTQFPNPGAGQAPLWHPSVGFGPGDHSFYNDFAVGWWSDSVPAIEPYAMRPSGSWCYLGAGQRFTAQTLPADLDAQLFDTNRTCR